MDFKIEDGVPIPTTLIARHSKYPLAKLEIGQSFFVPEPDAYKICTAMSYYGKRNGKKFISRKEGDGRRVWRVE